MIVKDLLDSCNIENVTSVIMEIASVDESDRLSVKKAHSLYIQRIRSIEPVNTNHIIFGVSFLNDGKETPDALLFSKNEIDDSLLSDSILSTLKNIQSLDLNDIEQILETTTLPSSYAFEFSPWNEILGYDPRFQYPTLSLFRLEPVPFSCESHERLISHTAIAVKL